MKKNNLIENVIGRLETAPHVAELKKILNRIEELKKTNIDINLDDMFGTLLVKINGNKKFYFQNESYDNLYCEYKNSLWYDDIWFEDYILLACQNWE